VRVCQLGGVAVTDVGEQGGVPVLYHHGTPGTGLYRPVPGIRMIGYDRPGYGGSARRVGRDVAAAAADVEAIVDALGIERFATWGVSGGGPHALACAALLVGTACG
jgi:pimeloyl-ACP methyl ester carboxylesterase